MKEKFNRVIDELAIVANIAVYAAVCGAAWELGKSLCSWIFRQEVHMEKTLKQMIDLARGQILEIVESKDLLPEDMKDLFFLAHTLDECLSKREEVRERRRK